MTTAHDRANEAVVAGMLGAEEEGVIYPPEVAEIVLHELAQLPEAALLRSFKAECDKVGIPYDPPGLVHHHRNNAEFAAYGNGQADLLNKLTPATRALVLKETRAA